MHSIYGSFTENDRLFDIMVEKLKTESAEDMEKRTGLRIMLHAGIDCWNKPINMCKLFRLWENMPGFEEETKRRIEELVGQPVECVSLYGEFYIPGDTSGRGF